MLESVQRTHHDEPGAGNQVMGLEDTINTGFRGEIVMSIRDMPGQLPGRQVGTLQRHIDDQLPDRVRYRVPVLRGGATLILKAVQTPLCVGPLPTVNCCG